MLTCPNCNHPLFDNENPKPASKAPEEVVARRTIILENPGARASQLAAILGCSVDTVYRIRREYELR